MLKCSWWWILKNNSNFDDVYKQEEGKDLYETFTCFVQLNKKFVYLAMFESIPFTYNNNFYDIKLVLDKNFDLTPIVHANISKYYLNEKKEKIIMSSMTFSYDCYKRIILEPTIEINVNKNEVGAMDDLISLQQR